MPRKRYKLDEIVAKLRQADVMVSQGQPVAAAVRSIDVTEVTYYLYGWLFRCKSISNQTAWSVANIYPASPKNSGAPS